MGKQPRLILSPGLLVISRNNFGLQNRGGALGICWVEARGAGSHAAEQNDMAQYVNSTKNELGFSSWEGSPGRLNSLVARAS